MKKAVIFDLDGTLLNTLGDLTGAVNHALSAHGFPTHTEAEVRTYIGDGVKQLIARSCPVGTDQATRQAVLEAYLPHYAAHNMDLTAPYPGVLELMADLKDAGYRLGVVSNKHAPGVKALTARYFEGLLDIAVGGDGTRPLKPAPDNLLFAMEQMGDSVQDVQTARNAGVKCIAVTWGFQDEDRLQAENPTAIAHTAPQVKTTIFG